MSCSEQDNKTIRKCQRKRHIRKSLRGTAQKPRMSVYKSNAQLYVQVIDDEAGHTIAAASTLEKDLKTLTRNIEGGHQLGLIIGKRVKEKNILSVVFDRNGYKYHGIVKAIADGAREAELQF